MLICNLILNYISSIMLSGVFFSCSLLFLVFKCEYPCIFVSLVRKEVVVKGRLLLKYLLISTLAVWLSKRNASLQKETDAVWCQPCQMWDCHSMITSVLNVSTICLQKYLHWLCYRFACFCYWAPTVVWNIFMEPIVFLMLM